MNVKQAGRKGGLTRSKRMTAKQRTLSASKAAHALWAKIRSGELTDKRRRAK